MKKEKDIVFNNEERDVEYQKKRNHPVLFLLLIAGLFAGFLFFSRDVETGEEEKSAVTETRGDLISVSGKRDIIEKETVQEEALNTEAQMADELRKVLFGSEEEKGIFPQLTVKGWTEKEKEEFHFQETKFLYQVAGFLKDQDINTSMIEIGEELDGSSPGMQIYQAKMSGVVDKELLVLVYPSFEGCYSFILQKIEKKDAEENMDWQTGANLAVSPVTETPFVEKETVIQPQTERSYDASRLNVNALPKVLLNYIDNPYELKFHLYDYLYKNGYRDERSITCVEYSIDPDSREAKLLFELEDGTLIQGIYKKNENRYSFYE